MSHICEQTTKYSVIKDSNKPFNITTTDLKRYLGICVMTFIVQVQNIRQYWSSNLGNLVIKSTIKVIDFKKFANSFVFLIIIIIFHQTKQNMIDYIE